MVSLPSGETRCEGYPSDVIAKEIVEGFVKAVWKIFFLAHVEEDSLLAKASRGARIQ